MGLVIDDDDDDYDDGIWRVIVKWRQAMLTRCAVQWRTKDDG